jgi:hypothetical protein
MVNKKLPEYDGLPSNTVCSNTNDIQKYIDLANKGKEVRILFFVSDRPCLNYGNENRFFIINVSNENFKNYFYKNLKNNEYKRKYSQNELEGTCGNPMDFHFNLTRLIEMGCCRDLGFDLTTLISKDWLKKNAQPI